MAARKIVESFSQKLDLDSEILSLKEKIYYFLPKTFLSAALYLFQQPIQIEVTEFLGNRFPEAI